MELEHGIFAVKLCELEREYGRLQSRIQLVQGKNLEQIHREREHLQDEYCEHTLLLNEMVQSCRSPIMARFAEIQQKYGQQAEELLQTSLDEGKAGCRNREVCQDHAEKMTLYAEFAIDFATQAMRYALIMAVSAIELQKQADEYIQKGDT